MGNGMMCATTPKSTVSQGVTNTGQIGAPPPPPPTGAVGGGVAPHLSALAVSQIGVQSLACEMVSIPHFQSAPVTRRHTCAFKPCAQLSNFFKASFSFSTCLEYIVCIAGNPSLVTVKYFSSVRLARRLNDLSISSIVNKAWIATCAWSVLNDIQQNRFP